jgi:hypothetical protein
MPVLARQGFASEMQTKRVEDARERANDVLVPSLSANDPISDSCLALNSGRMAHAEAICLRV